MANISILSRLVNGVQRNVDLSSNTLVVNVLKVGGGSGTDLTKAILDNLITLQNGSDIAASLHHHDGRYFTETELGATSGTSGAARIGVSGTPTNYSAATPDVQAHLAGIDSALATAGGSEFGDDEFRINDDADPTKQIAFQASAITTGTVRTISMPDANVNLADVNNALLRDGSRTLAGNLLPDGDNTRSLGSSSAAFAAIHAVVLRGQSGADSVGVQARRLADGSGNTALDWANRQLVFGGSAMLSWGTAGQLSANSNRITNLADPTSAQDAATKAYVDQGLMGVKPKQAVRVATTANINLANALENGDVIDGVTLATGNRVLVKDQTDPTQNGIYIVQASGAAVRATDFDQTSPVDEINGSWVGVQEGTANAGKVFIQYGTVTTVGSDAINFTYFNDLSALSGGDMIVLSGGTISLDLAATSGLESTNPGNAAGQLRIKLEASNPSLQITGSNELAAKLSAAGAIASGASGLAVQVDGSSIEINANALRVKAAGINENHLAASVAGAGLTGGAGAALAVGEGDGIDVGADSISVNSSEIAGAGLEDDGSNNLRIAAAAYDQNTITGGAGAAAAVQHAPLVKKVMVAGEAFAANTSFLVRFAVSGETSGRVYKADKDASTSDLFWCVGIAHSTGAVSAGGNITVTVLGTHTLGSSDTTFGAGDIGKAVFLTSAGAFSVTAPSAANEACFKIGTVEAANKIFVDKQMMGVN